MILAILAICVVVALVLWAACAVGKDMEGY